MILHFLPWKEPNCIYLVDSTVNYLFGQFLVGGMLAHTFNAGIIFLMFP